MLVAFSGALPGREYIRPEVDEGFEWMDKAIDARDRMMAHIRHYPFLDRFR